MGISRRTGRVMRLVDVMHSEKRRRMVTVELDENFVCLVQNVGAAPTEDVSTIPPPAVTSHASTTAQCTGPRNP